MGRREQGQLQQLPRHERRRIEREQQEAIQRTRNIKVAGGAVAAGLLVAAVGYCTLRGSGAPTTPESSPTSITRATPFVPNTPTVIVDREILENAEARAYISQRIARYPSTDTAGEWTPWRSYDKEFFPRYLPNRRLTEKETTEVRDDAYARLWSIVLKMTQSKIKQMADAGSFFKQNMEQQNFLIRFTRNYDGFGIFPYKFRDKGKTGFELVAYLDGLEQSKNPISLALSLVHEHKHAINSEERKKKLKEQLGEKYTYDEFLSQETELVTKKDTNALEEADAYAHQAEAFLEAYRYGYDGGDSGDEMFVLAQKYLEHGRNPQDPRWVEYISVGRYKRMQAPSA